MINCKKTEAKFGYSTSSLSKGSNKEVVVNCDYCGAEYSTTNKRYYIAVAKFADIGLIKDCCGSCKQQKTREAYSLRGDDYEKLVSDNSKKAHANRSAQDKALSRAKLQETWASKSESEIANIITKRKETLEQEYGSLQDYGEHAKQAVKKTMLERYGVENASYSDEIVRKRKNTFLEKYGVENPGQIREAKQKIAETQKTKYGGLFINQPERKAQYIAKYRENISEIREKIRRTNLDRYGEEHYTKTAYYRNLAKSTRITNDNQYEIEGKTTDTIAAEIGYSRSYVNFLLKNGIDPYSISRGITNIESVVRSMLDKNEMNYTMHETIAGRKTDFVISNKIVIEADGLYFHSESNGKPKRYHQIKRRHYLDNGYLPLFFRADEISGKPSIIESIILNKLGKSKRVFARKCVIVELDRDTGIKFLADNHLMGVGRGDFYALQINGETVSVIQVRNTNKKQRAYEISRFCHKNKTNVIGGFSRLVKFLESKYDIKKLVTYIDLRYGSGSYLESLGFAYQGEYISFAWTNGRTTYHRMRYRGNTGYEHNLTKIWDCGQAKYVKYF